MFDNSPPFPVTICLVGEDVLTQATMDQDLKTDAVTLTKTLCGHLAAAQIDDLSQAAIREARRGVLEGRTAPGHHKGGWHLTGTLGSIAAGVAAGKLLGLDRQRLTFAMGIAATQAGGMQQNRGTMCKSFHAGKAAQNGVLAALLAA